MLQPTYVTYVIYVSYQQLGKPSSRSVQCLDGSGLEALGLKPGRPDFSSPHHGFIHVYQSRLLRNLFSARIPYIQGASNESLPQKPSLDLPHLESMVQDSLVCDLFHTDRHGRFLVYLVHQSEITLDNKIYGFPSTEPLKSGQIRRCSPTRKKM